MDHANLQVHRRIDIRIPCAPARLPASRSGQLRKISRQVRHAEDGARLPVTDRSAARELSNTVFDLIRLLGHGANQIWDRGRLKRRTRCQTTR